MCLTLVFNLQAFKLKQIHALIVFDYKFLDDCDAFISYAWALEILTNNI